MGNQGPMRQGANEESTPDTPEIPLHDRQIAKTMRKGREERNIKKDICLRDYFSTLMDNQLRNPNSLNLNPPPSKTPSKPPSKQTKSKYTPKNTISRLHRKISTPKNKDIRGYFKKELIGTQSDRSFGSAQPENRTPPPRGACPSPLIDAQETLKGIEPTESPPINGESEGRLNHSDSAIITQNTEEDIQLDSKVAIKLEESGVKC